MTENTTILKFSKAMSDFAFNNNTSLISLEKGSRLHRVVSEYGYEYNWRPSPDGLYIDLFCRKAENNNYHQEFLEIKQQCHSAATSCYDIQKLRIQTGNRLVSNFKTKLGIDTTIPEENQYVDNKIALKLLADLRSEYELLSDATLTKKAKKAVLGKNLYINTDIEETLVESYIRLHDTELAIMKTMANVVAKSRIYQSFLSKVKGCGPVTSCIILAYLDPYKARYPASFHKYAGLDVAEDGKARSLRNEHLVLTEYVNRDGELDTKLSVTYRPFLKSKLLDGLGKSFIKTKSPYAQVYYDYKNRLENHLNHKDKLPIVRHKMAVRYMVKRFLIDLHKEWRAVEGLEVTKEYAEAKLGYDISHHKKLY